MSSTAALVATLVLQVAWSAPQPPTPPPPRPTVLEQSFGAGSSSFQTLEAHYYCTFGVTSKDGWSTCLHWDNGNPDPLMAKIVEAEATTADGGCILAINAHPAGKMCVAWKSSESAR